MNDDYAFYDTGALAAAAATSRNNTWAGASHWKFVGVKKKVRLAVRGAPRMSALSLSPTYRFCEGLSMLRFL